MMMARNSVPDGPKLAEASVVALRSALQECLSHSGDAARLQAVLRNIATEARSKQMRAEQLLIALKDVWYSLPQLQRAPEGDEQNRMLQRIVTQCIREYYAARPAD